jgi:hypothetical protein
VKTGINRRQFHAALGWGAASIALSEFGLSQPARAEENFTLASTGATWGEGLRASFVDAPKFEEKNGIKVIQEFAIDSEGAAGLFEREGIEFIPLYTTADFD